MSQENAPTNRPPIAAPDTGWHGASPAQLLHWRRDGS